MAHAHCMLDTKGYKRTLRICNTDFFSTATMVARTCLNVKLYAHQWRIREFCSGGGSTNSLEDIGQRGRGSGGGSPLVKGSGGSCNLVQEISFHVVKFS